MKEVKMMYRTFQPNQSDDPLAQAVAFGVHFWWQWMLLSNPLMALMLGHGPWYDMTHPKKR